MQGIDRASGGLTIQTVSGPQDFLSLWNKVDVLLSPHQAIPGYVIGYASSDYAVEQALRLRFQVFNVELNEGLSASVESGLDRDAFDNQMTHVLALEQESMEVVGTYRIQIVRQAMAGIGLYSSQEYDLSPLEPLFDQALELGRACTDKRHRKASALMALWHGLQAYVRMHDLRWLFGCCSLTSTNTDDGWRAMKTIRDKDFLHHEFHVLARPKYSCGLPERENDPDLGDGIFLPRLFSTYMRLGGKVVSEPAIDREFGTVDFLVLLDAANVQMSSMEISK